MKEKMKYLVAILIMATICIVFIPIINIGNVEISIFDIIKVGFMDYGDSMIDQTIMSVIDNNIELYAYILIGLMILILFNTVMVAVLGARNSYGYAIVSGIIVNVIMFAGYSKISDELERIEAAIQFFGQEEYIYFCKEPGIVWAFCYGLVLVLSLLGIMLLRIGDKKTEVKEIIPEEFYFEKNPWENKPRKELLQDEKAERYISERIPPFYGAIQGKKGMFHNKVYTLDELIPVYFVKKDEAVFLMKYDSVNENIRNHMLDEVLAEIYYVPQYQEYVVKPVKKLKVYLESGQPLGKERSYYLPRTTDIYFEDKKWMFTLS